MTAHEHPLLDVMAARRLACDLVMPIGAHETLSLSQSAARVAAQDVLASVALPVAARSAMDGFALRLANLGRDLRLPVAGTVAAGALAPPLPPGTALRIFTGAVVPEGADAVIPVEDCAEADDHVRLSQAPKSGANIRPIGSEQPLGGVLLRAGTRIRAQHIGLLASNGINTVTVLRRPRVALFASGDELRTAGGPESIHDSNRPMLMALAVQAGAEVDDLGILPDAPDAIAAQLAELKDRYDLVLTSGAVSMGGRDYLRPAFLAAGGQIEGWRVAIKPGKPVVFGRLGRTAFTGLPGNPCSAFTGFHLFAASQIAALMGQPMLPLFAQRARAGFEWTRKPGRAEVFPVRLSEATVDGVSIVQRLGQGVSATLFPLAEADGLAFVPGETTRIELGDALHWSPFAPGGL